MIFTNFQKTEKFQWNPWKRHPTDRKFTGAARAWQRSHQIRLIWYGAKHSPSARGAVLPFGAPWTHFFLKGPFWWCFRIFQHAERVRTSKFPPPENQLDHGTSDFAPHGFLDPQGSRRFGGRRNFPVSWQEEMWTPNQPAIKPSDPNHWFQLFIII